MEEASQLLKEQGPQALATAMAILDSRHADLQRAVRDRPSILSEERATFAFWRMILTIALPAQRAKPGASLLGCTMMIHDAPLDLY